MADNGICYICKKKTQVFSEAKILNKYNIVYYLCSCCGFLFTENPYWLNEAYSEAINLTDTGLVKRNIGTSKLTKLVIQ
jgi:hypothetical protein